MGKKLWYVYIFLVWEDSTIVWKTLFYDEVRTESLYRYVIVMGIKLPIKQCRFYTHYVTLIVLVFVVKPALLLFFLMLLLS